MKKLLLLALTASLLVACNGKPQPSATPTPVASVAPTLAPTQAPSAEPSGVIPSATFQRTIAGEFNLIVVAPPSGVPAYFLDTSCQGDSSRTCPMAYANFQPTTPGVYQMWLQIDQQPPVTNGTQTVTSLIPSAPWWGAFADIPFGTPCPPTSSVTVWLTWTPQGGDTVNSSTYVALCPQGPLPQSAVRRSSGAVRK